MKWIKKYIENCKHGDCMICGDTPCDYHHITHHGRRLGHEIGYGLCFFCHRGDNGFDGKNRGAWDKSISNQLKLCQESYRIQGLEMAIPQSKVIDYKSMLEGCTG